MKTSDRNFQVELTGDLTPDLVALLAADIIISTPEKWDGISRNWQNRKYVTKVVAASIWNLYHAEFFLLTHIQGSRHLVSLVLKGCCSHSL